MLVVVSLSACIAYQGPRQPNLVAAGAARTLEVAPRIRIDLRHRHTDDGQPAGAEFTERTLDSFRNSLERVRGEFPYLANSHEALTDAEYTLLLDTGFDERDQGTSAVSGYTLAIVPAFITSDVTVRAVLRSADGTELGACRASGQLNVVVHLLLAPALPIALPMIPGDELFDDTMRDALIQIEGVLARTLNGPDPSAPTANTRPWWRGA